MTLIFHESAYGKIHNYIFTKLTKISSGSSYKTLTSWEIHNFISYVQMLQTPGGRMLKPLIKNHRKSDLSNLHCSKLKYGRGADGINKHTDKQVHKIDDIAKLYEQTDRHTVRCIHKQTDRQTDKHIHSIHRPLQWRRHLVSSGKLLSHDNLALEFHPFYLYCY